MAAYAAKPCIGLANCCAATAEGCAKCCAPVAEVFCNPERPFPICLCFTILTNAIPAVFALVFLIIGWDNECTEPLETFVLVGLILNVINTLFAVHLYRLFLKPYDSSDPADRSPFARGWKIFLYDPVVCVFFLVAIFEVVWLFLGNKWLSESSECRKTDEEIYYFAYVASIMLETFLGAGVVIAMISLTCECLRQRHQEKEAEHARAHARRQERDQKVERARQSATNAVDYAATTTGKMMSKLFGAPQKSKPATDGTGVYDSSAAPASREMPSSYQPARVEEVEVTVEPSAPPAEEVAVAAAVAEDQYQPADYSQQPASSQQQQEPQTLKDKGLAKAKEGFSMLQSKLKK